MQPKAQHYVPKVYLRNFANQRKKEYYICCFDKVTNKIFKPNIKNIANQIGFYDFSTSDGEKDSIETFFNETETQMKSAFQTLSEKPNIDTLLKNSPIFAKFIALQELRTPIFRDEYNEIIRLANQRFNQDGLEFPSPNENETIEFQAQFLIKETDNIANILLQMKWILVFNETPKPFWTSDNPIIRYNPYKSELTGNLGLLCQGIQLYLPISPVLLLTICDPIEYSNNPMEISAVTENIDFNNSGQVINSRQYVLSTSDNFILAQDMIRKNPDLSNPNRPRITMANYTQQPLTK